MAKSKTAELLAMFARFLPPVVARFRGRGRGRGRVQLPRFGICYQPNKRCYLYNTLLKNVIFKFYYDFLAQFEIYKKREYYFFKHNIKPYILRFVGSKSPYLTVPLFKKDQKLSTFFSKILI